MEVFSVLVTGANRGIGLEFVRQFVNSAKPPKHVFATYRSEGTIQELKAIQNSASPETKVHLLKMDVTVLSEIQAAREAIENAVGENGLTLLINNAAAGFDNSYPNVKAEILLSHFKVNTVGPIILAQAMLPLLKKAASRKTVPGMSFSRAGILNISSVAGSISNTGVLYVMDLHAPGYKMSKAALNMGMKVLATVMKDDNILIVCMCPGWVKTDMGTEKAELRPEESIAAMLDTISKLDETHHGTYMNRLGETYDW